MADTENEGRVSTPPLPPDTIPLSTQVSGHFYGKKATKLGMLELKNGTLVKPLIPPKGDAELRFYREVFNQNEQDEIREGLRTFLAEYHGIWTTPLHEGVQYIILENITAKFNKPCMMDVKVGPRTWQPGAPEEKRLREIAKYPPQPQVGFRLLGIKVYHSSSERYEQHDHLSLRKLLPEEILPKGIAVYLSPKENTDYKRHILRSLLHKLRGIESWFEKQTVYHFFASSLLFVYEGKPVISSMDNSDFHDHQVDIRLIDFTHVFPANGLIDDNYLTGVKCLIRQLESAWEMFPG